MDLLELKQQIQSARWFSNLGNATSGPAVVTVNDLDLWRRFIAEGVRAEFGLSHDDEALSVAVLGDMEWLPGTIHEEDPIHGARLSALAEKSGKTSEFKAARLEAFKLAQASLRPVPQIAVLTVGGTNLEPVARGGALFAVRMAASEIVVGEPGFWCSLIPLYHQGNWPMGRNSKGKVVLL